MSEILAVTDHIAVFPRKVALHYAETLASYKPPFEIPQYRVYLCWDARSNADTAVMWLKDEVLRLGRSGAAA